MHLGINGTSLGSKEVCTYCMKVEFVCVSQVSAEAHLQALGQERRVPPQTNTGRGANH